MPNILSGTIQASAPTNSLVGVASAQVVAFNASRKGLILTNIASSTMYLAFDGNTAVLNSGVALNASGGVFTMDEYNFSMGQVNAIAHSAGQILCIQEFTT